MKAHPDRGGDAQHFNEVSAAYTAMLAMQEDIEDRERSDEIEYEAIVEKVFATEISLHLTSQICCLLACIDLLVLRANHTYLYIL